MLARFRDTLLIVGDENSSRHELREIFQDNYNILEAENSAQAAMLLRQDRESIALVIMDTPVSDSDRIRELIDATQIGTDKEIPTVVLADAAINPEIEERAFLLGAADVLLKPFTTAMIMRRIQTLLELHQHKWSLKNLENRQSELIRNANQIMIDTLSDIIEYRSTESGNHVLRIRRFTQILLEELAVSCPEYGLTGEIIDIITSAAALHDIGKISIPDEILNKPDKLSEEEFEVMKSHTVVGSKLVNKLAKMGEEKYLRYAYNISLYHHERWDGNGYPYGLSGDQIPICAQVVGLADAFDALTTKRVYKPAYPYQHAINMIVNGECGEFSPKLLECFKHVRSSMVNLAQKYADGYNPKADKINVILPDPVWQNSSINTLDLSQAKYKTLMHYVDDTVIELDMDNQLYHVVYNPNPEFDSYIPTASFDVMIDILKKSGIHPDDRSIISEMHEYIYGDFFTKRIRRCEFSFRMRHMDKNEYQRYRVVFLRVNTGNVNQHIVTMIWSRVKGDGPVRIASSVSKEITSVLTRMGLTVLECRSDMELTIVSGADKMYQLLGFDKSDILELYGNSFMKLVEDEDLGVIQSCIEEAQQTGRIVESEVRLKRKSGDAIWAMVKCRTGIDADGRENYYFAMWDFSEKKRVKQKIESDLRRNQMLLNQSGSIVFEWDLLTDTMICSPKWVEHFGYYPISEKYGEQMGIATHFHPDDLPLVRQCIKDVKSGSRSVVIDVRIANSEGKYLWTKITASGDYDKDGRLVGIIGILQDIDELKRAAIVLKHQAQIDGLTKLLNKASVQTLASDYLAARKPDEMAGLMVLDIDNFKTINDTMGHLHGDLVLSQMGSTLKKLFRSDDLIGRIGGDEFVILLRDIPDVEILEGRCKSLLETLGIMLKKLTADLPVSCSIGAAIVPDHGTDYEELFARADEALYVAKHNGKNQYRFYGEINS